MFVCNMCCDNLRTSMEKRYELFHLPIMYKSSVQAVNYIFAIICLPVAKLFQEIINTLRKTKHLGLLTDDIYCSTLFYLSAEYKMQSNPTVEGV